ncbi:hypothetical protein NQ315_008538 [Exocentrus adspersus]|uniref:Fibrinogen C-terminal domain-containing protein n=1 Tax=Exocentrus adspersus TaxID=1586481 RepID=A0AAV8W795_9CUCU|nr:hypothetical protein NQ315_008538 [Exocentrus adspersus]
MEKAVQILVIVCASCVLCVPPSPTSAVTDLLKAEMSTMKNTVKVLSDQWEKWNTLFLTSLEPRIASTASTLASIDSNIHNLQERAHVWDTFQLHVSAWNEQLASLDRKMDIISKGQEKVLNLDTKINAMLNMDYKLDNTIKILNNIHDSLTNLDTTVYTKKQHDELFNEFATRGVLSSIKLVEKKLDRLLIANQNSLLKTKVTGDEKPKFTLKCNTPRFVEDLLNDISSKVDVIFDNISNAREETDDTDYDTDYLDLGEGSGVDLDLKNQKKNKRLRKAIKKDYFPLQAYESSFGRNFEPSNKENMHFEKLAKENTIIEKINQNSIDLTGNINLILDSYFNEQRAHFESISNRLTKKCYGSNSAKPFPETSLNVIQSLYPTTAHEFESTDNIFDYTTASSTLFDNNAETSNEITNQQLFETTHVQPTWTPIINQNKSSCEDLDMDDSSGVYIFSKDSELFFNKRYCEIRADGLWTVIQRRDNYSIQHNFNVSWEDYKYGFGDLHKDFWMGNEFLSVLSQNSHVVLRIELEDFDNHSTWAEYGIFKVAPESDNYALVVGGYKGNASDSFSSHNGSRFSTYDKKNDEAPECCPCAVSYGGGWWFNRCFESNLNGVYHRRPNDNNYFRGIIWEHWLGNYSLKKTVMMVKSKDQDQTYANSHPSPKFSDIGIPYYEDP